MDDPNNLVDLGFGSGAYAFLFRLNNDYTGIKDLILDATFKYDLYLPTSLTKRVFSDVFHPITNNREEVDIAYGSQFQLETTGTYQFYDGFNLSLMYRYAFKLRDNVSGNLGYNYGSLEDLTNWNYHMFKTDFPTRRLACSRRSSSRYHLLFLSSTITSSLGRTGFCSSSGLP